MDREPGGYSAWGCKEVSHNSSDWIYTVISTAVRFRLILIYCSEVLISGWQKDNLPEDCCCKEDLDPTLSTLGSSETAVMTWDQGLIGTVLRNKVNNVEENSEVSSHRKSNEYSVSGSTPTILSVGLQGEFFCILLEVAGAWWATVPVVSKKSELWGCTHAGVSERRLKMG